VSRRDPYAHLPCQAGEPAHVQYAKDVRDFWAHLGDAECRDQVEWHMESQGYSEAEIDEAMEAAFGFVLRVYRLVTELPA
jgi:hypothetical protein